MLADHVILVDENDNAIGELEKMRAHELGLLHRAFSVLIFNEKGELLLQQRAAHKYHSPLLWTNTCCSHPRPGESVIDAAKRRLQEEMGMQCPLQARFQFLYKAKLDQGLTEHELDHVMIGYSQQTPQLNPEEVADYKWLALAPLTQAIQSHPEQFTVWFRILINEHLEKISKAAYESF
ncbi:MAG: hypothetical protein RLZZ301_1407 [Bacteroidota bacterium]|jgi:isopentenyl-diphosphate delta-isomerase